MDPTEIDDSDGMLEAVESGVAEADAGGDEERKKQIETEERQVKALWEEYEQARKFDKDVRAQYAIDRRYAAGTANLDFAVRANLIGSFIDILVSFLYARNPDVSIKKAPRVRNSGTGTEDDFAKTSELVVSSLWKSPITNLKTQARRQVRSTLSVGSGWAKAILVCRGQNIPQIRTEIGDLRNNIQQLEALRIKVLEQQSLAAGAPDASANAEASEPGVEPPVTKSQDEIDRDLLRFRELELTLQSKLEAAERKVLVYDFVSPDDIQVSLDVPDLSEYLNARWIANAIYRPCEVVEEMFPSLKGMLQSAKRYYQKANKDLEPLSARVKLTNMADGDAQEDERYVSGDSASGTNPGEKGVEFLKIVELWNRETGHVHTMVDGVKRWAKQPYQPDYASSRFYPYFNLAFYTVDGARHPQSLSWRLASLGDEYCSVRSSQRLTRKRAIPGTVFNSSSLGPEEAAKIERSEHQEYVGIKPTNPDQPLRDIFAAKPVELGSPQLFDTSSILSDMERISGVQEALQSSKTTEKTATEAEIQQSGFASRTTSDRDTLETMLTDLAQYTLELALQGLDIPAVQRIAGKSSYWPAGMSIDDIVTMVEVQIEAGTTGKPKSAGDKEAWGVILPQLKEAIVQYQQLMLMGDTATAEALKSLVEETMRRMGDETDVSRFFPQAQPLPGLPGAAPGVPGAPPGAAPSGPGAPGAAGPTIDEPAGAPGAPQLQEPALAPPALEPPMM